MNNKIIGSKFEKEMAEWLGRQGYWVHFLSPGPDGSQPCDLVAAKSIPGRSDGTTLFLAIDCKTLAGENKNFDGLRFPLSRIEENQETSFERMNYVGISSTYFAIKFNKSQMIVAPSQVLIEKKKQGCKSVPLKELTQYGIINLK